MGRPRKSCRATMAAWLLGCQLAAMFAPGLGPSPARAQKQSSRPPLERGQEYYEQARFDEAITLLKDLVDRGALTGKDLLDARQILARSYVKKGYPVLAKDTFKAILRDDPAWRPDPIRVPPDETAVFEQALAEFQSEATPPPSPPPTTTPVTPDTTGVMRGVTETVPPPKSEKKSLFSKWWLWAVAGAAAAGIAIAAGGGGDGDDDGGTDLPGFPPPP